MFHHVAHTIRGRLLFYSWGQGFSLWHRLVSGAPGLHALCLMPDHVHLLHPRPLAGVLGAVLSGHTRASARWGRSTAPALRASPAPELVVGQTKRRRSVRYVHLNPCRARLVDDPLAWPLSTHLDALGATLSPARPAEPEPARFHAYVSADPTVRVGGSDPLHFGVGDAPLDRIVTAVAWALRVDEAEVLERRGAARALFLGVAPGLSGESSASVAAFAGVHRASVHRARTPSRDAQQRLARLAADPRIAPLDDHDLARRLSAYARSRGRLSPA